ncbi:MAG: DUF5681 domain-containing protein [Pseudomonadota bacterium]
MSKGKQGGGGYGDPPVHSQFKPGQSGNPNGRPPGSKNKKTPRYMDRLAEMVVNAAEREVQIKENGKLVSVPMARAMFSAIEASGLKGIAKSQKLYFELVQSASQHIQATKDDVLEAAINYKEDCRVAAEHCNDIDMPCPEFFPNPDHIKIDSETGEVTMIGPLTRDDHAEEMRYAALRKAFIEELSGHNQEIGHDDESCLRWIEDQLVAYKGSFKFYEELLARDDLDDDLREAIETDIATEKGHVELLKKHRRKIKARMKKNSTSGKS